MPNLWRRHKQVGILADRALCSGRWQFRMSLNWVAVNCADCISIAVLARQLPAPTQEGN